MPSFATAYVNHRLHPKHTVEEVVEFDRKLINDDRIELTVGDLAIDPHPISSYDSNSFGYQIIKRSILQVFNDTIVVPGIMIANTDTRFDIQINCH